MGDRPPSRALLIVAGLLTQLCGAVCLVLALASLPIVHDLHGGTHGLLASAIAAIAAMVCGTLAYRGHLVAIALALGIDLGFGIALPRGGSALGALLRILPADDKSTAHGLVTGAALAMFVAAVLCALAIPSALALRRWARAAIAAAAETGEDYRPSDTLRGIGPTRVMPTQIVRIGGVRSKPLVIGGVAVAVSAIGIAVIISVTAPKAEVRAVPDARLPDAAAGADAVVSDSAVASDAGALDASAPSFDDFIATWHAALAKAAPPELAALLDARVFAFGAEANEVAQGRDAVAAQLVHDLAGPAKLEVRFAQLGKAGDVAWVGEELRLGTRTFVTTAIASLHDGAWSLAALHFSAPMANDTAYRLAREGNLGVPDAIPDTHDTSPLADAMRAAFASKPSFVEARSTRLDALNFGSALGERIVGGDAIKKTFSRIRATLHLHGAVAVGKLGDTIGWGAANVDFTDADRDGTDVPQTFRVLALWVKEEAGWRMLQTQFSNPM